MNPNIERKLDQFVEKLELDPMVVQFQEVQKKLLKNPTVLADVQTLHSLDPYDLKYKEVKQRLFQKDLYKEYLHLNQEFVYWTYEISQKLKECMRNSKDESD